jgi:ribosomal protein L11 methyltransferase
MEWYEISISVMKEAHDIISYAIMSVGANGVAIDDPKGILRDIEESKGLDCIYDYIEKDIIIEKDTIKDTIKDATNKDVVTIKGYFPGTKNIKELIGLLNDRIENIKKNMEIGNIKIEYSRLNEADWANSWKLYYKPFNITENIVVKPTWEAYQRKNNEIVINIDPGMAFGTGTHETTKMCVLLLEEFINEGDVIVDIGSGSGILSIASAKLGAKSIVALDIDEIAIDTTLDNCKINGIDTKVRTLIGTLSLETDFEKIFNFKKADVIVANIVADVIIDLCEAIKYHTKKDGKFIASGIIKDKKDKVMYKYINSGFKCSKIIEEREWIAIVFTCPGSL